MGDFQKAADYVKRHDAVAPPDPYNLTLQGMMHALMGQFDKADAKFHEALGIQADFSYTLMWLAMTCAVREKLEESLKWAQRVCLPGLLAGAEIRCLLPERLAAGLVGKIPGGARRTSTGPTSWRRKPKIG